MACFGGVICVFSLKSRIESRSTRTGSFTTTSYRRFDWSDGDQPRQFVFLECELIERFEGPGRHGGSWNHAQATNWNPADQIGFGLGLGLELELSRVRRSLPKTNG